MSDSNSESPVSLPPVWVALIPIAFLLVSMGVTIIVLGKDPHIPLILTAIVAALVARWHGASWTALERGMLRGIGVEVICRAPHKGDSIRRREAREQRGLRRNPFCGYLRHSLKLFQVSALSFFSHQVQRGGRCFWGQSNMARQSRGSDYRRRS